MDRREDGQPEFGGTCVVSRQPAFSVSFENPDYHETLRWLLTTKTKNVIVMVVYAYPGRGK